MKKITLIIFLFVTTTSCEMWNDNDNPTDFAFNDTIDLKYGDCINIQHEITVCFDSVSRTHVVLRICIAFGVVKQLQDFGSNQAAAILFPETYTLAPPIL